MEIARQVQLLFGDCYQKVSDDGDPDLGFHGVGGRSEERLDPQMLLDPLEEQFHVPPLAVDVGHRLGGDGKQVGQKNEALVVGGIVI